MADEGDKASKEEAVCRRVSLSNIPDYTVGIGSAVCLDCGELIPAARKKAVPNTTLCIDCARR